jgi:hypothetical protein
MTARLRVVGDAGGFSGLVQDLLGLQAQVQQDAPQLSGNWGYLAQQGQLLAKGQPAALTQAAWVAAYRSFYTQLNSAVYGAPGAQSGNFLDSGSSAAQLEDELGDAIYKTGQTPIGDDLAEDFKYYSGGNSTATAAGQAIGAGVNYVTGQTNVTRPEGAPPAPVMPPIPPLWPGAPSIGTMLFWGAVIVGAVIVVPMIVKRFR